MVVCLLCSQEFAQVTNTHLKCKHDMTVSEYRDLFPTAALQDESIIMKGEKNPFYGKTHSKETIEAISLSKRGKALSLETREKISRSILDPNSSYSKTIASDSYRKKLSESLIAYWSSSASSNHRKKNSLEMSHRRAAYDDKLRCVWNSDEYRKDLSQRMIEMWKKMSLEKREKRAKNNRLSYFRHNRNTAVSSGELKLYEILRRKIPDIIHHKWVKSDNEVWCIDMYIPSINTYVQFDGIYWHGLDRDISEIERAAKQRDIDKSILEARKRDMRQNEWFLKNGKRLVRITDIDFLKNPDVCVQKVLDISGV